MSENTKESISKIENALLKASKKIKIKDLKNITDNEFKLIMENFLKKNPEYMYSQNKDLTLATIYLKNSNKPFNTKLSKESRSYIIDQKNLRRIFQHSPQILYDSDAKKYLERKKIKWEKVKTYHCFKETMITLYYHNDSWNVATPRKSDAFDSRWNSVKSYGELFQDILKLQKIDKKELNKKYCYTFVCLNKNIKNIVDYSEMLNDDNYNTIILLDIYEKYTMKKVKEIKPFKDKLHKIKFKSLEKLKNNLEKHSTRMEESKNYDFAGYVLKTGKKVLIMRPKIIKKLENMKPNFPSDYMCYLGLYQKNQLNDYLSMYSFTEEKIAEIINLIDTSVKQLSKEILNLYHSTRNKQNQELYQILTGSYKTILYNLHGVYGKRKKEQNNEKEDDKVTIYNIETEFKEQKKININIHDVYNILKNEIETGKLSYMFYERVVILNKIKELSDEDKPEHPFEKKFAPIKEFVKKLYPAKFYN